MTPPRYPGPGLPRRLRALLRALWAAALAVVPALAFAAAAAAAAEPDPLAVRPALLGIALLISSLAGATALLIRFKQELQAAPEMELTRPWLTGLSHMLGAWTAGVAAFILAKQFDLTVWPTLAAVLSASFANARFLEMMLDRALPWAPRGGQPGPPQADP